MKMSLEENQGLADTVITPILKIIDSAVRVFEVDRLKESLEAMKDQTSTLAAFPTPETMDKAESMKASNELFEKIIDMMELRKKQKEITVKQSKGTVGNDILKQMGML